MVDAVAVDLTDKEHVKLLEPTLDNLVKVCTLAFQAINSN